MHPLSKKLHSERGLALALSMLYFLVCTMVGIVILTSATTNSGRLTQQKEQQQAYLAASSAAKLLTKGLEGQLFARTYDGETGAVSADANPSYEPLAQTLRTMAERFYDQGSS